MAKSLREMIESGEAVAEESAPQVSLRDLIASGQAQIDEEDPDGAAEKRASETLGLDRLSDKPEGTALAGGMNASGLFMPSPRNTAGKAISAIGGAAQGGMLDFADEAGAAKDTAGAMLMDALSRPGEYATEPKSRLLEALQFYRVARGQNREVDRAAHDLNPKTYGGAGLASAVAMPVPGAAEVKGASTLAQIGKGVGVGAGYGSLLGAGASEADLTKLIDGEDGEGAAELGKFAGDVGLTGAIGGGLGLAGGLGGMLLAKLRGRAQQGVDKAVGDQTALEKSKAEKASKSALGTYRSSVQTASRDLEVIERAARQTNNPKLSAQARAYLAGPEGQALIEQVAMSKLGSAPERIAEMQAAKAAHQESLKALAPEAIEAATEKSLADPLRTQLGPRAKTYANRAIPMAVGGAIGGPAGIAAGSMVANAIGRPTTAMAKAMQSAPMRKLGWESLLALTGREAPNASQAAKAPLLRLLERGGEQTPADYIRRVADAKTDDEERQQMIVELLRSGAPSTP